MGLEAVRTTLYTWMQRETGITIIFAEQSKQRPELPYGSIKFVNPAQRVGSRDEIVIRGQTSKVVGQRTALASLNIYGKRANDIMSQLLLSLDRPDVIDMFAEAGMSHIGEEGPRDLTELMETKYQERSQMDLTIGYAEEQDAKLGFIEKVEIENQVKVGDEDVPLDETTTIQN